MFKQESRHKDSYKVEFYDLPVKCQQVSLCGNTSITLEQWAKLNQGIQSLLFHKARNEMEC